MDISFGRGVTSTYFHFTLPKELLKMEQIGSARKSTYSLSSQFGTPSEPDVLRAFKFNFASMEKR